MIDEIGLRVAWDGGYWNWDRMWFLLELVTKSSPNRYCITKIVVEVSRQWMSGVIRNIINR